MATESPQLFLCPISMELMEDPVTVATGVTYERRSIERWFFKYGKATCPATMQHLASFDLTPNHTLKRVISSWAERGSSPSSPTDALAPMARERLPSVLTGIEATPFKVTALKSLRSCMALDGAAQGEFVAYDGIQVLSRVMAQALAESGAGGDFSASGRRGARGGLTCYLPASGRSGGGLAPAGGVTALGKRRRSNPLATKDDDKPRWVRAPALNLDDHIIVVPSRPDLPDKAVEDYAASLSTAPMDRSRPMWEFHLLDFPTSNATSTVVIRVHHSLGDGMSLLTLLMASTRSAADPSRLPAMPAPPARSGDIYARPRPPTSAGALAFLAWLWSFVVLAWHTVVDVTLFVATIAFVRDPQTLFKRADIGRRGGGGERPRCKRFVNRSLSLVDVKFVKNAMNCTVNDVLVGVTSAALSRYYFRRSGDNNTRKISLRSILLVNIRPTTSLQAYVDMIESGNSDGVKWGNQLGYIILPFHIAMYEDPLQYVRKAKKIVDRKKSSLEVVFTHMLGEVIIKTLGVKAAGVIFHRMISHTSISFSNMIGPAEEVEFYGHPVVSIAPSAYGPPEALTVHYQSYSNTIKVILAVDEDHFPDHGQLLDDFIESLCIIKDGASLK
uniref:Uncharacterized protein n=1 Tax=Avena sativa TaxID=4498 RepID=A0ACD5TYB7_AVESA